MSSDHHIVDRLAVPREAFDQLVRVVPDGVVRARVADYVRPAAPAETTNSLVDKLVEKFGL
jgi:hypothetical protein